MNLLTRLRRHSKSRRRSTIPSDSTHLYVDQSPLAVPPRYDVTRDLPRPILARIFAFVCPHAADDSYKTSEESMTVDGCMPCDMRDLAHCAAVCKRWSPEAQRLLYASYSVCVFALYTY